VSLESRLAKLEFSGLILLQRVQPEVQYLFRHVLVQEAAYTTLLRKDRQQIHLRIGEILERMFPSRTDEFSGVLGHHFSNAGRPRRAAHYYAMAGDRARLTFANLEAIGYYQAAIAGLADPLGEPMDTGETDELLPSLYERAGDVLELIGKDDQARANFQDALARLPAGASVWKAALERKIGKTWESQRRFDLALQSYVQAEDALGADPGLHGEAGWQEWIRIQLERMMVSYWLGQWQEIALLAERTRDLLQQFGTPLLHAQFLDRLIGISIQRDRYRFSDDALALSAELVEVSQASGDLREIANGRFSLGFAQLWRDELEQAEANLVESLRLAEQIGSLLYQTWSLNYLSVIGRKRGQTAQARDYARRGLAVAQAAGLLPWIGMCRAQLGWVAWREGQAAGARVECLAALAMWETLPMESPFHWMALWPLIGLALKDRDLEIASRYAKDLFQPLQQAVPEQLAPHLLAAVEAWETGQREVAEKAFSQAAILARELGYL
jgi:tetratricopeptide (TPR) repeat protein